MTVARLVFGPDDAASPAIRDRILIERKRRCEVALPNCGVRATAVIRLAVDDDRGRLVVSCANCIERMAAA